MRNFHIVDDTAVTMVDKIIIVSKLSHLMNVRHSKDRDSSIARTNRKSLNKMWVGLVTAAARNPKDEPMDSESERITIELPKLSKDMYVSKAPRRMPINCWPIGQTTSSTIEDSDSSPPSSNLKYWDDFIPFYTYPSIVWSVEMEFEIALLVGELPTTATTTELRFVEISIRKCRF